MFLCTTPKNHNLVVFYLIEPFPMELSHKLSYLNFGFHFQDKIIAQRLLFLTRSVCNTLKILSWELKLSEAKLQKLTTFLLFIRLSPSLDNRSLLILAIFWFHILTSEVAPKSLWIWPECVELWWIENLHFGLWLFEAH